MGNICIILDSIEEDKLNKFFYFKRVCHSLILDLSVLYLYLPISEEKEEEKWSAPESRN